MTDAPRILAFAGSLRKDSLNKKVIRVAAEGARRAGAEVTVIDLGDYQMPIYDGDLEEADGLPEAALRLKELMAEHDGFLISSPEYNSSVTAVLKNTIDWVSRSISGEDGLAPLRGKVVGLMAASPGALGGLRGLVHLRAIMQNIGVMVITQQKAVAKAGRLFDEDGAMMDEKTREALEAIGAKVAEVAARLNS